MGRYYGVKIHNGIITIAQVPQLWKAVTEKWLRENPAE